MDEAESDELSRAVVLYFSRGKSSYPKRNPDAVDIEFGSARGEVLTAAVERLDEEISKLEPDWSKQDLAEAADWARAIMAERHPELSKAAIDTLRWQFAFGWK